jgi:hypothetical protein
MNSTLMKDIGSQFLWLPDLGFGYYPAFNCKTEYFDEYKSLEGSEVCERINHSRVETVARWIGDAPLLDFGIGAGTFIIERGKGITFGYDRDGNGVRWLMENDIWCDPHQMDDIKNISFWDAFEHLEHPETFLNRVSGFVFMSIPIFIDCDHILQSKHFKTNEHFWYFTLPGFVDWMREFDLIQESTALDFESVEGREDVYTFIFRKI